MTFQIMRLIKQRNPNNILIEHPAQINAQKYQKSILGCVLAVHGLYDPGGPALAVGFGVASWTKYKDAARV